MIRRLLTGSIALALVVIVGACSSVPVPTDTDWCYIHDFTEYPYEVTGLGEYVEGEGWKTVEIDDDNILDIDLENLLTVQAAHVEIIAERAELAAGDVTIEAVEINAWGIYEYYENLFISATITDGQTFALSPETFDNARETFSISLYVTKPVVITQIVTRGYGASPFPEDNCTIPAPDPETNTPEPTITPYTPAPTPTESPRWVEATIEDANVNVFRFGSEPMSVQIDDTIDYVADGGRYASGGSNYSRSAAVEWVCPQFSTVHDVTYEVAYSRAAGQQANAWVGFETAANVYVTSTSYLVPSAWNGTGWHWADLTISTPISGFGRIEIQFAGTGVNADISSTAYMRIRTLRFLVTGYGAPECGGGTATSTPSPTVSATNTITPTPSRTPSPTVTNTRTRIPIVGSTMTPNPSATLTGSPMPTISPLPPTNTRTLVPTNTPFSTFAPSTITATSTGTATINPSITPTGTPDPGEGPPGGWEWYNGISDFISWFFGFGTNLGTQLADILNQFVEFFNLIVKFLDWLSSFIVWFANTIIELFDWLISLFFWVMGTMANIITQLSGIATFLGAIVAFIVRFIFDLLQIAGMLISIIVNALVLFVQWFVNLIRIGESVINAYMGAPITPIPGFPQCRTNPVANDICAMWYVAKWTILHGTIGQFIVPALTALVDLALVASLIKIVKALLKRAEGVTKS